MTDEMKALIDSVAHDIADHRWPHVDAEAFEELRQAHLDLAEKIVTEVLAALSAHPTEETVTTVEELEALPDESVVLYVAGGQHGVVQRIFGRWYSAGAQHPEDRVTLTAWLPGRVIFRPVPEGSERDG